MDSETKYADTEKGEITAAERRPTDDIADLKNVEENKNVG